MPQYQQQKKGQARVRILPKDAARAYLILMRATQGRMQALPNEVYVIDDNILPELDKNQIEYETLDLK